MTVTTHSRENRRFLERVVALHDSLGIACEYRENCRVPLQVEEARLVSIGPDIYQREQFMHPDAAPAWHDMQQAATRENVVLQVVSAYRSLDYQAGIIQRKLDSGQAIGEILRVSAAPGYSEHHTGCAVDVTTPGSPVLEEPFENSEAYAWLEENAGRFGFRLSFPRDNPFEVIYEPWHWAWKGA